MSNPIQSPTKLKLPQAEVTPDIMSASGLGKIRWREARSKYTATKRLRLESNVCCWNSVAQLVCEMHRGFCPQHRQSVSGRESHCDEISWMRRRLLRHPVSARGFAVGGRGAAASRRTECGGMSPKKEQELQQFATEMDDVLWKEIVSHSRSKIATERRAIAMPVHIAGK